MHLCDSRGTPRAGTAVRTRPRTSIPAQGQHPLPVPRHLCTPTRASLPAGSPLPHRRCLPHPRRGTPAGTAHLHFPQNVPKLNPPSLKPRTAGRPPSRVGAAPTARPPRVRSPSLPGLARRLRSAAHSSSSGRRHVRAGAGAPARPAQPPVPRGPIPPPLSAWGGGSPPALPARAGSGRDGAGWQRGCTRSLRSRPAAAATGEAGGGDGEVAPRRRGDAPDGADPPPPCAGDGAPRTSRSRGAAGTAPPVSAPAARDARARERQQRCPLPGTPRARSGGRGTPELPAAVTGYGAKTYTRSSEPEKPRSHKGGKPERKANPWPGKQKCHKLRNGADRMMSFRCILPQATTRAQL